MFKQLKFNLPFIDVLQHMPKYGKFLKELISNKKKLEGISEVSLSEQCSTVVHNKPARETGGFGSFHDPMSAWRFASKPRLDLGEPQSTRMSISLADRSVKYSRGIVENMLVRVEKFVFPVDFVILDLEVDAKVPLILGRPFLRTAKAMIDVFDGKLTLRVGDESITLDAMKPVEDVGEHSHSVCMLDAFIGGHRDYDPEVEFGVPAPNLGEISEWALVLEKMFDEPDAYGDKFERKLIGSSFLGAVSDDCSLSEILAQVGKIVCEPPMVGSADEPDDPVEIVEAIPLEVPIPKPLLVLCSEGITTEPVLKPIGLRCGGRIDVIDIVKLERGRNLMRFWRIGKPRGLKAVPVRIKEKPPDMFV
ncbi:hypothetical protein L1987_57862 [Smallanthus sonchifolius]|uniref:Uncharacterized protein n=1 Tax=Smallanthus sonchifolius TaxID=185202 RepID=A0ACB9DE78_9ASTR|nr:hypothetical protein L1987_57862 [Smallanthus sonchifolius]